jgi:uncharacterized integral membrane protein
MARGDKSRDDEDSVHEFEEGFKPSRNLVIGGISLVVAAVFILSNTHDTQVQFLFFEATVNLWVALLFAVLLGLGGGYFLGRRRRRSRREERSA